MGTQTTTAAGTPSLDSIKKYDRMFLGHPMGLLILSMNEVWERFSFYGLRAILVLYMMTSEEKGGMGLSCVEAAAIFGLYTCLGSVSILPGGWIADNLWGPRTALLCGAIIMTIGHVSLMINNTACFFLGLGLIIIGTGLIKPASSAMVNQLYPPNDTRQEAGYTIYYMCINVGALMGALVVGYLAQRVSWHFGFGAAVGGMVLGVVVYVMGYKLLGPVGLPAGIAKDPVLVKQNTKRLKYGSSGTVFFIAALVLVNLSGIWNFTFVEVMNVVGVVVIILPIACFAWIFRGDWTKTERNHIIVMAVLFCYATLFTAATDQRGSILTLFAEDVTHCYIGSYNFPSTWFTALNSALVIVFTPFFAWLWPFLGKRNPSIPGKFAWSMFFSTASFVVMIGAAMLAGPERNRVGPEWLFFNVFLITVAEMFIGPVGVSAFARLAPQKIVSQMMAIWYMKGAIAGLLVVLAGSNYEKIPLTLNFGVSTAVLAVATVVLILVTPKIRRLMGN